jgi:hypothetical protein
MNRLQALHDAGVSIWLDTLSRELLLLDRGARLYDLAEALDQRPNEIRRAGRSLSMRGLTRWHHAGRRKETRLEITSSGLTTVRALLTAAGAPAADADRPETAVAA